MGSKLTFHYTWQNPQVGADKRDVQFKVNANGNAQEVADRLLKKLGGRNLERPGTKCDFINGRNQVVYGCGPLTDEHLPGAVEAALEAMRRKP